MTQLTTTYNNRTDTKAVIRLKPTDETEGRFQGEAQFQLQSEFPQTIEYIITNQKNVYVEPIDIVDETTPVTTELKLRMAGEDPSVTFEPKKDEDDLPSYTFELPSVDGARLCHRFLKEGVTEELVKEAQATYESPTKGALFAFISDAKCYLTFKQYMSLFLEASEYSEGVRRSLASKEHRLNFFKNLLRKKRIGEQYPVLTLADFESYLAEYRQAGLDEQLGEVTGAQAVEKVIEDANPRGTHLAEICDFEEVFVEYAPELGTGYFIHLLSESLLQQAPSGDGEVDPITWSGTSAREVDIDSKQLVERHYSEYDVDGIDGNVIDQAYEKKDIDLFKMLC